PRETYLEAFTAALFVGRLSPAVGDVARAARMAPAPLVQARAPDLLLDGLALLVTEGYTAGTPALRRALLAVRGQDISAEEGLSWLWLAERAAMAVWDDETWHFLASRYDKALAAAELVCEYDDVGVLGWSLTELVEAAVRSGQPARASGALMRLSETTRASGTDWALGAKARSRALLSEGQTAEDCYR